MIAIPTLVLGLLCLFWGGGRRRWIPLGLLLSAVGDLVGARGYFELQIGAFALALIAYTADFIPYGRLRSLRIGGVIVAFILFFALLRALVAKIPPPLEALAVCVYALLLFAMLSATLMQHRKRWGAYVVAALLFILSDSLIGYSRYVAVRDIAEGWILLPYYAAQLIFSWCYLTEKR